MQTILFIIYACQTSFLTPTVANSSLFDLWQKNIQNRLLYFQEQNIYYSHWELLVFFLNQVSECGAFNLFFSKLTCEVCKQ